MRLIDSYNALRIESIWEEIYDLENQGKDDYSTQQRLKNLKLKENKLKSNLEDKIRLRLQNAS